MWYRNFINLTDVEKLINIAIEGKAIEIDDDYFIILDVGPKMIGLYLSLSVHHFLTWVFGNTNGIIRWWTWFTWVSWSTWGAPDSNVTPLAYFAFLTSYVLCTMKLKILLADCHWCYVLLSWLSMLHSNLIFSRAVLCSLTGNILGLKSRGGRWADDMHTTCGWCADDMQMTREWDFIGDFGWWMTYVVHTLSAGRYVIQTLSAHRPQVGTSSAHCLQHSSWSA